MNNQFKYLTKDSISRFTMTAFLRNKSISFHSTIIHTPIAKIEYLPCVSLHFNLLNASTQKTNEDMK